MGAENSILEGCSWEDELVCPQGFPWKLSPIAKNDGTEGVVFQAGNSEKKESELLQKCAKTLLRLRHPNVIRFLGSGHSSKGFWMAAEPVVPIFSSLSEITSEELVAGVQDVLQALDFMHTKLGVCHNNICPSSVYISKDGGWKLGGMEHTCKFQEATPDFLDSCRVFRDEMSLAPEETAGHIKSDLSLGHARDVFAVGALVDALMDMVKEKDELLKELEQQITICVSSDPSQRPTVSCLLNLPVFRSDFISLITFVRNVTMKTDTEKKEFFSHLLSSLQNLPELVIARRLVVPLLSRFVLLDEIAKAEVLPHVLVPRTGDKLSVDSDCLLDETLYKAYVIPHLCNIFRVHDCHIRLVLLKYFSAYVHLFSREQLEEDIFLQVLLGVRDSDDNLVAASLKALADLVPILGGDYVIGGTRKTFFFHGLPKQVTVEVEPKAIKNGGLNFGTVLSNAGPPLLKDIASGANNSSSIAPASVEDREKKMKERQQRREEARLKREERRRILKEKQLHETEADTTQTEPFSTPTIEQVAEMVEGKKALGDVEEDESPQGEDGGISKNATASASDWSDWEGAEGNISDDIELELKHMSSSHVASPLESKVPTSPSPYSRNSAPPSPPPITVDWSDMPEADRKIPESSSPESSTLYSHSKDGNSVGLNISDNNSSSVRGDKSSFPSRTGKSLKLKSPSYSTCKTTAKKKSVPSSLDDLGAGYDIKSIEIKSALTTESDFFADMAPRIPAPSRNPLDVLSEGDPAVDLLERSEGKTQGRESGKSSMFAVLDAPSVAQEEEDTSGWGADADEDMDWGNDSF